MSTAAPAEGSAPSAAPRARGPVRQAACEFIYVTAAAPLGLFWLILFTVTISVGAGLSVIFVGLPILAVSMLGWRGVASLERDRAALVLGAPIPAGERPVTAPRLRGRMRQRIGDPATWRDLGYLALLCTAGLIMAVIVLAMWGAVCAALAYPFVRGTMPDQAWFVRQGDLLTAGVVAGGVIVGALALLTTSAAAHGWAALARRLLAPDAEALLAQRVSTLEETRAGVVESADATLRRIERDLHDGAQHRLAYIAMTLSRAQDKLEEDPKGAAELLDGAHGESKKAMKELRDLVRGIHPSVLTDRGLDAAVSGLGERCPVPCAIRVELRDRRPPAAVETAAYFVVAESLTNVARHSGATRATVEIRWDGDQLLVTIADDGRGGASRAPGSGLEGLSQRVEALDGRLTVSSPEGGPTTIRAELPCAS
jgi:signal transduction histidine kinase